MDNNNEQMKNSGKKVLKIDKKGSNRSKMEINEIFGGPVLCPELVLYD